MLDLFLTSLVCLALFTLATQATDHNQRGGLAGYRYLAVFGCWLLAGPVAAIGVLVVGSALAGHWWQPENLTRARITAAIVLPGIWASAWLVASLTGLPTPLIAIETTTLAPLTLVLFTGWGASLISHWLRTRQAVDTYNLLVEIAFVVLTGTLPLIAATSGLPAVYLVITALGLHLFHTRRAAALRHQLQRQQQAMTLLNHVGQATTDHHDQDMLLWNTYQQVARLIDAPIFYIARYDAERDMLAFPLVVERGQRQTWPDREPGTGPTGQVIRHKKPQLLTANDSLQLPERPADTSAQPYLAVPLMVETEILGVMAILGTKAERGYTDDDLNLLQTIAGPLAMALHNATLTRAQTDLVNNLAHINDSVHQILFNNNRDNALEVACQTALHISGAQQVALFLINEGHVDLYLQTHIGLSQAYRDWLQTHPPAMPDRPHVSACLPTDSEVCQLGSGQAMAELPIRSDRLDQGMLAVHYATPHTFAQRELDLLEMLLNHVSAMLGNVQLFEVMENYAYEMSELVQLSRISTSSLDMDRVVHDIADMLRQMTSTSRVAIIALENERAHLLATVSNHNGGPTSAYLEPFAELVNLTDTPIHPIRAFQRSDDSLSPVMREQMVAYQEQTVVLVPLVVNNNILGAVWLGSQDKRDFEEHEWQFIEMATNQIAAQINNIRLYDRTRQELNRRLKQVSIIEEIARQVSSSLDFNVVIDHVLEAAINATDTNLASLGLVTNTDDFWVIEMRIEDGQAHKHYVSQPKTTGVLGQVLREQRAIIVPDNQHSPHYVSDYTDSYRSSLAVPLKRDDDDTIIGVLNVESHDPGAFSNEQAAFLVSLAGHAVMSIENARFLEERREEIDMLKNLRDLSLWLVSADDTKSVGYEILETALQLLDGQNGILYEYNSETDHLKTMSRLWYSEQESATAEEILPYAVAREAASTRQIIFVDHVRHHPAWVDSAHFNYQSVLAFPLRRSEPIHYVILMTMEGQYALTDRDRHTIDLLASQAIGHLENARLHERIREGRDQMRAILDSTRDGLVLLDREGRIIEANPSACHLLGFDLGTYIGQLFADALQKAAETTTDDGYTDQAIANLMMILRQQPATESRREFNHRQGQQTRSLEELGLPVRDEDEHIVGRLLVLRDVTAARLLEEQREDLADMVVHDLRGPLGAIINALGLVMPVLGSPDDQDDVELLLTGSVTSANRLLALVNTLLDISKMQHTGLELDRQPVNFAIIIETACLALATLMEQAHINMTLDLPADLPPVLVDQEKIERVVINLLDNALRYTPDGGEIVIAVRMIDNGWLETKIADSGPGIPPARRETIFERFQRIPGQDPQRGQRGHGLGLTFTRLAIEAHGGSISIGDHPRLPGACFAFTLPIAD